MLEAQQRAKDIHDRLMKPANGVEDHGIDLKRKRKPRAVVIPIDQTLNVPVTVPFSILEAGDLENICDLAEIKHISISDIQRVVCRHFGVTRLDMLSDRREVIVCWPRHVAMYLAKIITLKSYPHIGRKFDGRDHTTVMNAVRQVTKKTGADPALKLEVTMLENKVRAGQEAF